MKLKRNRILYSAFTISLLMMMTGCVSRDSSGNPTGFIWNIFGRPMSYFIDYFANNARLGYGFAIIIVTIIVRTLILPLGLYQAWKASYQSEKMNYLKPVFDPINERMKNASTQEEKMAAQTELMAARKEMGLDLLGGMGCLPLLIQMPFFSAMYFAAQYTKGVSTSTFMGIDLGHRSMIMTIIIVALYFIQSLLSMYGVPEEQRAQMKSMMFMMPIMMFFMSLNLPSGVALYWFVGGFFSIIQQLITMFILKPKLRQKIEEEFAKNPPKTYSGQKSRKDVTQVTPNPTIQASKATGKKNRNAGKQRKRK
ncbi:membrane protein oxaA 2 [Streptococcus urinalis FB127-CNA-2]|uniref:Membrane protein insertase YidC n=1 Tax=Streptococcus urinalis 2285-97 TaxID=764291 RepID=G5KI36_9STRE|nr:membrane protein insertase YidC [Streptococcus urinalis]EHJ57482.1 60Kd inner membrane protein [Streptococcus urinalis 2285-97]EKS20524.1 membrane protein oxaA 2 [Streptococcus urinalis FB127-CNA-2]VEF31217.1 OxaA-like protein [Streptococcus urinalis]